MEPELYCAETPEISGRVIITRRPRGFQFLDEDVATWRARGIDAVVSLLEVGEAELIGLDHQGEVCRKHGIVFVPYPLVDFSTPPAPAKVRPTIEGLAGLISNGKSVAFHCYASRGRSPTLAAAVLIELGLSADDAMARLSRARRHVIPETPEQRQWILDYAASRYV